MMNLVEQLKAEIASRYNLEEDQIRINLDIKDLEKEAAREILSGYSERGEKPSRFFPPNKEKDFNNDFTFSKSFHMVTTFIKKED